jgi:uridine kinase
VSLAEDIAAAAVSLGRARTIVAIDGPDAAGKTTLADAVAAAVTVPAVRASVDDFHNPIRVRRRLGDLSPEGYYRDAFDLTALAQELLDPFASGARRVRTQVFDFAADRALEAAPVDVPREAVLVVDGVFLLRPRLRDWWTVTVHLHVPPAVSLERGLARDGEGLRVRYLERYLPGQEIYRLMADPVGKAQILVDNTEVAAPVIQRWAPPQPVDSRG